MLLYDSFMGLNATRLTTCFQDVLLKQTELDFARKKMVASFRFLANPSRASNYKYFLTCCERALSGRDEVSMFAVMMDYLSCVDNINERDACEKLTQLFCLGFKHQNDALSIASMGLAFVDRPRAFAAFLRYLLQLRVMPEQILATHLLQNFFRYYLSSLGQANNSIEKLYQVLGLFEDCLPLRALAKQVCCDERGFSSYALDGHLQHNAGDLALVERIETPLWFTPNEINLKSLHVVFEVDCLMGILYQWHDQPKNAVWVNTVTQLFNQPHTVSTQLPLLVNRLHEQYALQQALAQVLNDASLAILVNNHVVGVLNLIPFCPVLVGMVQAHDLPAFFQALRRQTTSGPALFSSLFTFFNSVKNTNSVVASLVFDALLDAIYLDPSVLEDMDMIGKLRKFSHVHACIDRAVRALEVAFSAVIQMQTQGAIEDMDYVTIEDAWREVVAKIQHLREIVELKTTIPTDKYQLYIRLARVFMSDSPVFDLPAFVLALGMAPVFDAVNVTVYERFLVELLVAVDNTNLRTQWIQILDANVNRPWRELKYDGHSLFIKAALAGNLGLIQWMEATNISRDTSYNTLALTAAYVEQWQIVSYFHTRSLLTQNTINCLFQLAIDQGNLHAIPALWTGEYSMPDITIIENQFKLSVQKHDLKSLQCLIACPRKPREKTIRNAFNNAIALKYFDVAITIAEGLSGKVIRAVIEQTLKSAARLNHCDVLNALSTLSNNRPGQKAIESALIGATRANQLAAVKWLFKFSISFPRPYAIQEARDEACRKQLTHIDNYLSAVSHTMHKQPISSNSAAFQSNPIRHVASCNAMLPLKQQGFFRVKPSQVPMASIDQITLNRQLST